MACHRRRALELRAEVTDATLAAACDLKLSWSVLEGPAGSSLTPSSINSFEAVADNRFALSQSVRLYATTTAVFDSPGVYLCSHV